MVPKATLRIKDEMLFCVELQGRSLGLLQLTTSKTIFLDFRGDHFHRLK